MRRLAPILACIVLAATPVAAQEDDGDEGLGLMERGAEMFLRGMQDELGPALRDLGALAEGMGPALRDFVSEMGPALAELLEDVEDWSIYEPPERLPNGDIIIRRKPPEETPRAPEPGEEIEI